MLCKAQWVVSEDGENWELETFESKEAARLAAPVILGLIEGEGFYVGVKDSVEMPTVSASVILNDLLEQAIADNGVKAQSWFDEVSDKASADLQDRLTIMLYEWTSEYRLRPNWDNVSSVEKTYVTSRAYGRA